MGIELIPVNKQIEREYYNYTDWDIVFGFLKRKCSHLFSDDELNAISLGNGIDIPEWKANEISLLLDALGYLSDDDTVLDIFYDFCRDSQGFKVTWIQ